MAVDIMPYGRGGRKDGESDGHGGMLPRPLDR
jgi:hypothetical protein